MQKKLISLILLFTILMSFFCIDTTIYAAGNEIYHIFNFPMTYTPAVSYSGKGSVDVTGYPYFKGSSSGALKFCSIGTSDTAKPYPAKNAYANLQIVKDTTKPNDVLISSDCVNTNKIGYSFKIKYAEQKDNISADFPYFTRLKIRYGAPGWVNNVTKDIIAWEVTKDGVLTFDDFTMQLELGREYSLFILADQVGTNSKMSLYVNGELKKANRSMSSTGSIEDIYRFICELNASNGANTPLWRNVDFDLSDVKIYKVADINSLAISGESMLWADSVPKSYQFGYDSIIEHSGLNWSISPKDRGVTVSSDGLVEVNPNATPGSYTLSLTNVDSSVSAHKTITVQKVSYAISGPDTVYVAENSSYQKIKYEIKKTNGAISSDALSINGEYEGLGLENNIVKINEAFSGTSFTLNANINGEALSKTVQVRKTILYDFQTQESKSGWAKGSGGIESPWVTSDANVYLDPNKTRWESPAIIADPITSGVYTVEFDFLAEANRKDNLMIFSGANNGVDSNQWWGVVSKSELDNFFKYNAIAAPSFALGWNKLKFRFDFDTKEVKIFVNDNITTISSDKFSYGGASFIDYSFKKIITYIPIDDLCIYSGDAIDYTIKAINIPSQLVIPSAGQTKKLALTANVTEDSVQAQNAKLEWSIKEACTFASISDEKLIYDENAQGTITIIAKVKNTNCTLEKTISFAQPDVSFTLSEDNKLHIKGTSNESVDLKVYAPKDTSDNISKFLGAYSEDDAVSPIRTISSLELNTDGEAIVDFSDLEAGRYHVYVLQSGSVLNYDAEVDIKIGTLFDNVSNFDSEKLDKFLSVHTNATAGEALKIEQNYRNIGSKQKAVSLMQKDFKKFYAAVLSVRFIENISYDEQSAVKLKDELTKLSIKAPDFDSVKKNVSYTKVMKSITEFGNIQALCNDINTEAILVGIENVANKRDASYFLEKLSYSKYTNCTDTQKANICDKLAGNKYSSLQALKNKIDEILDAGTSIGGFGSGGGGSNSFVSYDSKEDKDYSQEITYPAENAAKDESLFDDVTSSHWAHKYINGLADINIINGYNGNYLPDNWITRAEFVKILVEAFEIEGHTNEGFADVKLSEWYYNYVMRAKANKLILGNNDNFSPDKNISREDAAVMVYRFANYVGMSFDKLNSSFTDDSEISAYASEAIYSLAGENILCGRENNMFSPKSEITRAEAAKIIYLSLNGGEN